MRILIVDDQPMVRQGLSLLLELMPDLDIVGQAADGAAAVEAAHQLKPDLILMDVRMPGLGGAAATARLRAEGLGIPIILMTTFEEPDDMVAGLRAGAAGYLFKNINIHDLHDAMRRVVRGEQVIDSRVARALVETIAPPSPSAAPSVPPLTDREQEILEALNAGQSNKQIASRLGISGGTVKTHVSNIFHKLGANNRTEAVYRARSLGLLPNKSGHSLF